LQGDVEQRLDLVPRAADEGHHVGVAGLLAGQPDDRPRLVPLELGERGSHLLDGCPRGAGRGLHASTLVRAAGAPGFVPRVPPCSCRLCAMSDSPADSPYVTLETLDGVATITLDSPHNRNALSRRLVTELHEHLETAAADDAVRVVLIQSSGKVFCSGADLSEAATTSMEEGTKRIIALQRLIATMPKVVVTKNLGAVRAGGIGIVAAADIAVSAEDATFALTEVKLGLAAAIISLTVHARMNPRAASLTTLGGEVFTGAEAAAYGLVTKAVPADSLDDEV